MPTPAETDQKEEIAILIADEIEHTSTFPLFSNTRGKLGVLSPGLMDESIRVRDFFSLIGLGIERLVEKWGSEAPQWSYERLGNYVEEKDANVNVVLRTYGGKEFRVWSLMHLLDKWNAEGRVTRGFVPEYAASAGATVFAHTGERHMGYTAHSFHHLASNEKTGEIYDGPNHIKHYLKQISMLLRREVRLEELKTDGPDKAVYFGGWRLQTDGVAKAYVGPDKLLDHFRQTTGINPEDYPELKAVFELKAV
ncbi:MAG: hypothetical protein WC777_00570 [Candidatus Gracilibacteria bacterium]|jgi:hypothetical protein